MLQVDEILDNAQFVYALENKIRELSMIYNKPF